MRTTLVVLTCLLVFPAVAAQPGPIRFPVHKWQPKPLPNPFAPTPPPVAAPTDVVTAILQAVAEAKATIVADLGQAQILAATPISNQVATLCESPAIFTNAIPAVPAKPVATVGAIITGTTMAVNISTGPLAVGQLISDPQGLIPAGTTITAGSAGQWTLSQTVNNGVPIQIVDIVATSPAIPMVPSSCSTPEVWDPLGVACFPAMINFINQLPGPGDIPTIPSGAGAGLVSSAEELRLIDFAAKQFIGNIKNIGYPNTLKIACDPWMLDWVTQANIDIALVTGATAGSIVPGGGLMNSLLLKFIPSGVAAKYGLSDLKMKVTHDRN
jgi:hypothetical protein